MLPGSQRAEEPRGNGPELPRTRNGGPEGPKGQHSAFRSPAPLNAAEAWCRVGGGRSIPLTRPFRPDGGTPCLVCGRRSHYGRKTERSPDAAQDNRPAGLGRPRAGVPGGDVADARRDQLQALEEPADL